ncbi:MAG: FAD-dependent oxidoreductase, partial [Clostridia bacterium]|nr:FAD-dependent oxidoreductase [Clostridia bacterium]
MEKLGIAIIGGGPAGLAAGIYAARGGANVKLFEELFPGGQIVKTHRVENYPGFTGGPDGYALAAALEKHASEFDLPVIYGAVTDLKLTEGEKTFTVNGEAYAADAVILCMGAGPRKLGHPDEDKYVGA